MLNSHLKLFWQRYHKMYVFHIFHFFKFLPICYRRPQAFRVQARGLGLAPILLNTLPLASTWVWFGLVCGEHSPFHLDAFEPKYLSNIGNIVDLGNSSGSYTFLIWMPLNDRRSSGGTLRQKFNLIEIWHLNIRTFEHLNIWIFEHLNIWTFEHLNI